MVGIDRVATSNKKKLVLAKMNYQQRQENIFSNEQNTENDDVENGDKENADRNESEIVDGSVIDNDELEHFIQNYSIVQYSIRIGDLISCNFKG